MVNILSSTSGLFTLILSAIFPSQSSDRFSVMKFLFVIVSIGGTVLISVAKIRENIDDLPQTGAVWALGILSNKLLIYFYTVLSFCCMLCFLSCSPSSRVRVNFILYSPTTIKSKIIFSEKFSLSGIFLPRLPHYRITQKIAQSKR